MLSRRQFLKGAVALGATAVVADGILFEPRHIIVEKRIITIRNLPQSFERFTLCQLTDVHHGPFTRLPFIERGVEMANALKPDLMVLTGDYVSESAKYIPSVISALGKLKSPYGTLAVLGNHDHWEGPALIREQFDKQGVSVITNKHRVIKKAGSAICIAGVGDFMEDNQDLPTALKGVPADVPRILLSHNPDYAEVMPKSERVDLMLSGHTHGGQIRMPFSFAPVTMSNYGQKYTGGLVRLPHTQVYVSRGIGVVGIPVRFNCLPEITLITLTNAVHSV